MNLAVLFGYQSAQLRSRRTCRCMYETLNRQRFEAIRRVRIAEQKPSSCAGGMSCCLHPWQLFTPFPSHDSQGSVKTSSPSFGAGETR